MGPKTTRKRGDQGFSLVEISVVVVIVAVLAAIAIPAALTLKSKGTDAAVAKDLLQISAQIDTALEGWNGTPPGTIPITFNSPTWALISGETTVVTDDASAGTTISGTLWADGSYCVQAENQAASSTKIFRSDVKEVQDGTCPESAPGGTGSLAEATAVTLPAQPTNLIASSPSDNTVTATWAAVSGATSYVVSVSGVPSVETTGTTITVNSVPDGTVTVAVRARNTNGTGPATSTSLIIAGVTLTTGDLNVDGEVRGKGQFRVLADTSQPSLIIRNDGSTTYLVYSDPSNQYSSATELRPFSIQNLTGNVGFGVEPSPTVSLLAANALDGAATADNAQFSSVVTSDVTTQAVSLRSIMNTAAADFVLDNYTHFQAEQGTIGDTSSVTSQYGFVVDPSLTGATNNYGFYGALAAAAGQWNLYMAGTAKNFLAGDLLIGGTDANPNASITTDGLITGTSADFGNGILSAGTFNGTTATFDTLNVTTLNASNFSGGGGGGSGGSSYSPTDPVQGSTGTFSGAVSTGDLTVNGTAWVSGNVGIGGSNLATAKINLNATTGHLGLGAAASASVNLLGATNISGAATADNAQFSGTVQSGVTTQAVSVRSIMNTEAANFTLADYTHFQAKQGAIGDGSHVTNQYGFVADSTMIGATNNYGFYGNIASGTGRWNLYMNGTAANYLAGNLGVGGTASSPNASINASTGALTATSGSFTGGVTAETITGTSANFTGTVTGTGYFTGNVGVGGSSGSPLINLNASSGRLGLGTAASSSINLLGSVGISGGAIADNARFAGVVQSGVTTQAVSVRSIMNTADADTPYTLADYTHFQAKQGTIGNNSTVTNQYGFVADSTMIGATNNYGFYGNIASGTGRWNLYMNTTAANYLAGNLSVGALANINASTGALTATTGTFSGAVSATSLSGITSTDRVVNLNADLLDDLDSTSFMRGRYVQVFTTAGTGACPSATNCWTKGSMGSETITPKWIEVYVVGGGGGGGTGSSTTGGGGGGGGGCSFARFQPANLNPTVPVTVGAAGTGGATPVAGGTSTFGSYLTANGGSPGSTGTAGGAGGAGGTGLTTNGTLGGAGGSSANGNNGIGSDRDACGGLGGGGGGGSAAGATTGGAGGIHNLIGGSTDEIAAAGGSTGAGLAGTAGSSDLASTAPDGYSGTAGGGGGTGSSTGGAGGVGARGNGGGGGGGSTSAGAGASGGAGYVVVITYY